MKTTSTLRNTIVAHATYLEALGIVQEWQEKAPKENEKLSRLAELLLSMLKRHGNLQTEVSDLELMNSLIRREKNQQIMELKEQLNK